MKKHLLIIAGIVLILVGVIGQVTSDKSDKSWYKSDSSKWSITSPMMNQYSSDSYADLELMSIEDLENKVNDFIETFNTKLQIGDILIFNDRDYLVSLVETDTKKGAYEIRLNPYTGDIYVDMGPHMMWNTKYDFHRNGFKQGRHHRGRMGFDYKNDTFGDNGYDNNVISHDQAYDIGSDFLSEKLKGQEQIDLAHEYYGYYTFYVKEETEIIGLLRINAFSGQVLYFDFDDEFLEIISR